VAAIAELRDAFEKRFAARLRDAAGTPEGALALRPDRWVDVFVDTFRELGKARGFEIAPIRRGVGDLGWELCWGRNLQVDYRRLSQTAPAELFKVELVLEIAEATLRAGVRPESAVEEAAADLARLLWARTPLKVLVFGARRDGDPANSIDALEAGLSAVIEARDRESDYLLIVLPNFQGAGTVVPDLAVLWTKVFERGKGQPARQAGFKDLLRA
jgi:hypothetical protein